MLICMVDIVRFNGYTVLYETGELMECGSFLKMRKSRWTRSQRQIENRLEQRKLNKILEIAKIPLRSILLVTLRNKVK